MLRRSLIGRGLLLVLLAGGAGASDFDLVLRGGRVIDPERALDAVRNVGIRGGEIAAISEAPLSGAEVIGVEGLVVAPGFIDLHSHTPTPLGQRLQVQDGVTTQLELEAGAFPVSAYGALIEDAPLQHYGASVGYGSARIEAMTGLRQAHLLTAPGRIVSIRGVLSRVRSWFGPVTDGFLEPAGARDRARIRALLLEGLDEGGLGIGLPLDYFSAAIDADELRMIFDVAAERDVPIFIHLRRGVQGDPAGLLEALALVEVTGASLHICHLQHNAMGNTTSFLARIRSARSRGHDVTTEVLPYNAGSALISSAVFDRDWQEIFGITYEDVQWSATGERFDESRWRAYREQHPEGQVIHHYVKETWTREALAEPAVIVVSDALPIFSEEVRAAPHTGAFARVLGRYSREVPLLPLPVAIEKMTLLPARRLEAMAPAFLRKGRLQVGADADISVIDPARVLDRATYAEPFHPSAGIPLVIVGGVPVVRDGALVPGAAPGRRLRATASPR